MTRADGKWADPRTQRHYEKHKEAQLLAAREYRQRAPIKDRSSYNRALYIEQREQRALSRIILKTEVYNALGNVCACCGEAEVEFLTIDHVNNDGGGKRSESGRRLTGNSVYLEVKRSGFDKTRFQILCMNCNWAKGRHGKCPHKKSNGLV
jgi:hypothetical protein